MSDISPLLVGGGGAMNGIPRSQTSGGASRGVAGGGATAVAGGILIGRCSAKKVDSARSVYAIYQPGK
jgi:hypothetical protein